VNATINTSENAGRQAPHPRYCRARPDPLRAAQLHNFALRLDLRRVRSDLVGPQQIVAVNRLLDATDAFGRALQWLRGGPVAADDGLEELERLAMESGVVPDAVEAVAQ
jgi:hypothetical protein